MVVQRFLEVGKQVTPCCGGVRHEVALDSFLELCNRGHNDLYRQTISCADASLAPLPV